MPNTEDLRYVRTEAAIRSAFMELVREAPVASVTASAVCRRAGISRNAFYLHHTSVAALYTAMVDELLDDMHDACHASARRISASGELDEVFVPSILSVLARHETLLRALLPSDDGTIAKCLADGISDAYADAAFVFDEQGGSLEFRLCCAFSAWALLGALQRWLELTNQPISKMMPYLSEFQLDVQAEATRCLIGCEDS